MSADADPQWEPPKVPELTKISQLTQETALADHVEAYTQAHRALQELLTEAD